MPIDERAHIGEAAATILPPAIKVLAPAVVRMATSAASPSASRFFQLRRRPQTHRKAIASFALEGRRELLEHHLHRGRAQHLDVDWRSHAFLPLRPA